MSAEAPDRVGGFYGHVARVLVLDVVSKACAAASLILLVRGMAADEFASLTLITSAAVATSTALSATFGRLFIVRAGHSAEGPDAGAFLSVQVLLLAILAALGSPLAATWGARYGAVPLLALGICLLDFSRAVYQQRQRFGVQSLLDLGRNALFLGAVLALTLRGGEPVRAPMIVLIQSGILLVLAGGAFTGVLRPSALRPAGAARLLRDEAAAGTAWLLGYNVSLALLPHLSVFVLGALGSPEVVATYGSAFRYYGLMLLALNAVHVVLLPAVARAQSAEELRHLMARHWKLCGFFSGAVAAAVVVAGWAIPWIDHGRYPGAVPVFRILAVSALISFAFSPFVNIVIAARQFRFLLWTTLAGVALNLGLLAVLVPRAGAPGAAIASLAAFGLLNWAVFLRARDRMRDPKAPEAALDRQETLG